MTSQQQAKPKKQKPYLFLAPESLLAELRAASRATGQPVSALIRAGARRELRELAARAETPGPLSSRRAS